MKDFDSYKFAQLSEQDKKSLKEKEDKLNMEAGKEFILIAYEKK